MRFDEYYQEALENGYAKIPMFWRENLLLSKKWFDDIRDTTPMMGLRMYEGPILAIAGDKDELVLYYHAKEIVENSKNENSKTVIVKNSNHTFNVLIKNRIAYTTAGVFSAPALSHCGQRCFGIASLRSA